MTAPSLCNWSPFSVSGTCFRFHASAMRHVRNYASLPPLSLRSMSCRHSRLHELMPCPSIQSAPPCRRQAEIKRAQIVLNRSPLVRIIMVIGREVCQWSLSFPEAVSIGIVNKKPSCCWDSRSYCVRGIKPVSFLSVFLLFYPCACYHLWWNKDVY